MDDELKAALSTAVKESISPLTERLDALEAQVAQASKSVDDSSDDETPVEDKINEAVKSAVAEVDSKYEELIANIEKSVKRASRKSIVGQDGDDNTQMRKTNGRDAFGRKRNTK